MTAHMARITMAICLLAVANGEITLSGMQFQIDRLVNDILGYREYQDYLSSLSYTPSPLTPETILQILKNDLASKIDVRVSAVTALRDKIQETFNTYTSTSSFGDCCACCSTNDPYGRLKFKVEVDLDTMCHTGTGRDSTTKKYPTNALLEVMKQNYNLNNLNLKWQYFGGEDGIMTLYPGTESCDETFDPRFRSWYSHTAFRTPKDVVIVVDRSGSMANSFHRDRSLMEIAKDAANTVLDTLNPDDRAAVVFFSNSAETSTGCYSQTLAEVTQENRDALKSYVNAQTGIGGTYYGRAFEKAFDFFGTDWKKPAYDNRHRVKAILFLTDGKPSDENAYASVIRDRNAATNNEVVIMTFGFGSQLDQNDATLTRIAHQNDSDPSAGNITSGRFVYVSNPDELRSSMATYYDFFSDEQQDTSVTVSIPYVDAFGVGFVTSLCLPVHTGGVFRGVTCVDITIADLFDDATYFSQNTDSYAFIVDGRGRLFLHPLLPRPSDVYETPTLLHVLDIETEPAVEQVVELMLNGTPGTQDINSRRVLSRGDSVHDGVNVIKLDSVYIWDSVDDVGLSDLRICVVLAKRDTRSTIVKDRPVPESFPYHSLDITQPSDTCRYINRAAIIDSSTIKFAPFAFLSPESYLERLESEDIINLYEQYFQGRGDSYFKSDVTDALAVSSRFDEVISKTEAAWQSSVWRYLGLREGVFRLYPGTKVVATYDHTNRPWYKRAVSQPGVVTLSKPYVDAFGAGIIVTLSKALFEGGTSDPLAGAMGMDFTLDLFNSFLTSYIPQCSDKECIAMDNAGYIISHPDFINIDEANFPSIENVHISQKEKDIASALVDEDFLQEDQCINFSELKVQSFWRATKSTLSGTSFEIKRVPNTNIFVIVKDPEQSELNSNCQCSNNQGLEILQCTSSRCRCPCFSLDGVTYYPCDVSFTFQSDIGSKPPCNPPTPDINLTSVANQERSTVESLDYCYDVETVCPSRSSQLNCSATAGCRWCGKSCRVRTSDACSEGGGGNNAGRNAGIAMGVIIPVIVVVIATSVSARKKRGSSCSSSNTTRTTPRDAEYQNSYAANNAAFNPDFNTNRPTAHEPPPTYGDVVNNPNF